MMNEHYPFELPIFSDFENDLAPILTKETLMYHNKHLADEILQLNEILKTHPRYHAWTLTELYQNAPLMPKQIRDRVLNHAGAILNHNLYFSCMAKPNTSDGPRGALRYALERYFNSIPEFIRHYIETANQMSGSGWLFLASDKKGKLYLVQTEQNFSPLSNQMHPILVVDMWEHAYYLQYKNQKKEYLNAWLSLIDWRTVLKHYRCIYAQ